ncbi:hypothetical protein EV426DRAFT_353672 [Tirmania nivea]|nr:hypothetical protein EV426DRAFT_353672 [Tirmania nivea]
MGKVCERVIHSDFDLYPPGNVVSHSYQNHQNVHTRRGVSTASSTPAHSTTAGTLISPNLSSVGDKFPSISSISYTAATNKSTPTSRKRSTPTLPIEDSFGTPPPSSKIRKTVSSTTSPHMQNLDASTRARSQRSQSPSQILASAAAEEDTVAIKRARNTLAARRYRQKRVERLEELEGLLAEAEKEKERYREEAVRWRME